MANRQKDKIQKTKIQKTKTKKRVEYSDIRAVSQCLRCFCVLLLVSQMTELENIKPQKKNIEACVGVVKFMQGTKWCDLT